MAVPRIEALADAIMAFEGWHPGDRPYRNRNPGDLRFSPLAIDTDRGGYAVFDTFAHGYRGLLQDLQAKCCGNTVTDLKPTSTLQDLVDVWAPAADHNDPLRYAEFVARFIATALNMKITLATQLSFFTADEANP